MNLRDLKYLVAVAKYRNFSRAAEAVHISQPTLSMQIKKLEDYLGVQLFERTNRHVHMTEAGQAITEKAKTVLQGAQDIEDIAQHFQDPYAKRFIFGAFPTLAPFIFPKVIPSLTKAFPKMRLYLTEDKTEVLLQKLTASEIDIALLALPIDEQNIEIEPLFFDPFYVAVSTKHPMASRKTVDPANLKDENLMLLEDGHCLSEQALEVCQWHIMSENNANYRATSIETLRQMVASNLGITLIPQSAILPSPNIKYIPLKGHKLGRNIALCWRKSSPFKNVFKAVAKDIATIFDQSKKL